MKAFSCIFDYYSQNNLLNLGFKIFSVMTFFNVDNEEKYLIYKKYFEKVKEYLYSNTDIYNEMDMYFANNIIETNSYSEYSQRFHKNVLMSYLRRPKTLVGNIQEHKN